MMLPSPEEQAAKLRKKTFAVSEDNDLADVPSLTGADYIHADRLLIADQLEHVLEEVFGGVPESKPIKELIVALRGKQ